MIEMVHANFHKYRHQPLIRISFVSIFSFLLLEHGIFIYQEEKYFSTKINRNTIISIFTVYKEIMIKKKCHKTLQVSKRPPRGSCHKLQTQPEQSVTPYACREYNTQTNYTFYLKKKKDTLSFV